MWFQRSPKILAGAVFILVFFALLRSRYQYQSINPGQTLQKETEAKGGRPFVKPDSPPWETPVPKESGSTYYPTQTRSDRAIVLSKLENEDSSWLTEAFSDWQTDIRTVDSDFALLHEGATRVDRGRIAVNYLTYIIENYHDLASSIVFLNTNEDKDTPATQSPIGDKVEALQNLKLETVQKEGYANLRCATQSACKELPLPEDEEADEFHTFTSEFKKAWKDLFQNEDFPKKIAVPCCSEFAVSRDQIKKRSIEEYTRYWNWLNTTDIYDDTIGLMFEYLWHIIFGRSPEFCPEVEKCQCEVFGKC